MAPGDLARQFERFQMRGHLVFAGEKLQPTVDAPRRGFQRRRRLPVPRANLFDGFRLPGHLRDQALALRRFGRQRIEPMPEAVGEILAGLDDVLDPEAGLRRRRLAGPARRQVVEVEVPQKHVSPARRGGQLINPRPVPPADRFDVANDLFHLLFERLGLVRRQAGLQLRSDVVKKPD